LQGWHLDDNQKYQPLIPSDRGWLWCRRLNLWLGTSAGTIDRETAVWLRFYDVAGNLVLLPEEAAVAQAESAKAREEEAKARSERLAAKLRELGENPDLL
jgi:hypothetical protein